MPMLMNSLYMHLGSLIAREEGQDLVEYAMLFSVIALGAVAGMSGLASAVNTTLQTIANTISNSVT
jgi:Flp pilus assembly pilin Flp